MIEKLVSANTRSYRIAFKILPLIIIGVILYAVKYQHLTLGEYKLAPLIIIVVIIAICYNQLVTYLKYFAKARQVYIDNDDFLNISNISGLFEKTTFTAVPFKLVDRIEYLRYKKLNHSMLLIYSIYLKNDIDSITSPIIFYEYY